MVEPFLTEELFEVSDNLIPERQGDYVIVDNYYKNYEEIHSLLLNMPVPNWKRSKISKNFIEYYDCRPIINNYHYGEKYEKGILELLNIIHQVYGLSMKISSLDLEFNYFKHIKLPKHNGLQMHPHSDHPIAGIVYLDKICSGGTAVYPGILPDFENHEHDDIFYDTTLLEKYIIPAKPNRLVLFPAEQFHGGYIEDHSKYLNDWRINQIMFFEHN